MHSYNSQWLATDCYCMVVTKDKTMNIRLPSLCFVLCLVVMAGGCANNTATGPNVEQDYSGNLPDWSPNASQINSSGTSVNVCGSAVEIPNGFKLYRDHSYLSVGVDIQWFHNADRDDAWFDVEVERGYTSNLAAELNGGLQAYRTVEASEWSAAKPEYGSINKHTCVRSYWKGVDGAGKSFHGFEYIAEVGDGSSSAIIKVSGRDFEPYSHSTILGMDAAARTAIYMWKPGA